MTQAEQQGEVAAPRGLLAPYRLFENFLEPDRLADLLDFAERHEAEFEPTGVVGQTKPGPDPTIRRSTGLRQLGEFRPLLRARLLALAPALIAELRLTPFDVSKVELELVAHGDGAFYKRHIDTATARDDAHMRVLSGVYYFHREPRAFSGGALRLYAIGDNARFVDIEPVCNALLVFPAWAPHEVMPVKVPSGRFADEVRSTAGEAACRRRLALNILVIPESREADSSGIYCWLTIPDLRRAAASGMTRATLKRPAPPAPLRRARWFRSCRRWRRGRRCRRGCA